MDTMQQAALFVDTNAAGNCKSLCLISADVCETFKNSTARKKARLPTKAGCPIIITRSHSPDMRADRGSRARCPAEMHLCLLSRTKPHRSAVHTVRANSDLAD